MNERGVAETIGAHMALSSPTAELWRKVAHGELSADDAAAAMVDGRASVSDREREEIERARVVFAPVAEARRDEQLEALLASRRQAEAPVVSLADRSSQPTARRSRGWVVGPVAIAAVLAAMVVLWLLPGTPEGFVEQYTLEISGMTADARGDTPRVKPGELPTFREGGTIHVGLRPDETMAGPLDVVGFARSESGEVQALSFEPFVHPSGKVDIDVPVRAQGLSQGTWELVFAVGREGEVPRSWEAIGTGGAGYVVVRGEVMIVPKP